MYGEGAFGSLLATKLMQKDISVVEKSTFARAKGAGNGICRYAGEYERRA